MPKYPITETKLPSFGILLNRWRTNGNTVQIDRVPWRTDLLQLHSCQIDKRLHLRIHIRSWQNVAIINPSISSATAAARNGTLRSRGGALSRRSSASAWFHECFIRVIRIQCGNDNRLDSNEQGGSCVSPARIDEVPPSLPNPVVNNESVLLAEFIGNKACCGWDNGSLGGSGSFQRLEESWSMIPMEGANWLRESSIFYISWNVSVRSTKKEKKKKDTIATCLECGSRTPRSCVTK